MTYRIHTVSELTGIPRNTLIAWERRYGVVHPERHSNHYRSYSDADVRLLKRLKAAIGTGMSVSEAIAWVGKGEIRNSDGGDQVDPASSRGEAERENRRSGEAAPMVAPQANPGSKQDPLGEIRNQLYGALIGYRGAEAERLLAGLLGVSTEVRIHQIFFPILRQIGEQWENGQLSVAQEHYAAAVLREQMISMLVSLGPRDAPQSPHAACTTFVGDPHELGALAIAVRLGHSGYRISYLGPNLPPEELARFCVTAQPDVVCVSAILKQAPSTLTEYAATLRRLVPERTRLIIGGNGIDQLATPNLHGVEFCVRWDGSAFASK